MENQSGPKAQYRRLLSDCGVPDHDQADAMDLLRPVFTSVERRRFTQRTGRLDDADALKATFRAISGTDVLNVVVSNLGSFQVCWPGAQPWMSRYQCEATDRRDCGDVEYCMCGRIAQCVAEAVADRADVRAAQQVIELNGIPLHSITDRLERILGGRIDAIIDEQLRMNGLKSHALHDMVTQNIRALIRMVTMLVIGGDMPSARTLRNAIELASDALVIGRIEGRSGTWLILSV